MYTYLEARGPWNEVNGTNQVNKYSCEDIKQCRANGRNTLRRPCQAHTSCAGGMSMSRKVEARHSNNGVLRSSSQDVSRVISVLEVERGSVLFLMT